MSVLDLLPANAAVGSSLDDHLLVYLEDGEIVGDSITLSVADLVAEATADLPDPLGCPYCEDGDLTEGRFCSSDCAWRWHVEATDPRV